MAIQQQSALLLDCLLQVSIKFMLLHGHSVSYYNNTDSGKTYIYFVSVQNKIKKLCYSECLPYA